MRDDESLTPQMRATRKKGIIVAISSLLLILLAAAIGYFFPGHFGFALVAGMLGGSGAWVNLWFVADLMQQQATLARSKANSDGGQKSPKQ